MLPRQFRQIARAMRKQDLIGEIRKHARKLADVGFLAISALQTNKKVPGHLSWPGTLKTS